jgi:hypothetical protein
LNGIEEVIAAAPGMKITPPQGKAVWGKWLTPSLSSITLLLKEHVAKKTYSSAY